MSVRTEIMQCLPDAPEFEAAYFRIRGAHENPASRIDTDDASLVGCHVAMLGGEPVGRIAMYRNPEIRHENADTLLLGNFECTDDSDVCNALLEAASHECRQRGASWILGPMNGSTWNSYRFVTEHGSLSPFVTEMQHPGYYPRLWADSGFAPVSDYVSNFAPIEIRPVDEKIYFSNGLRVHILDPSELESALRHVYPLVSRAFAGSPYYSPISESGFISKLLPVQHLLGNAFTRIVDNAAGEAVAFVLCIPDVLNPSERRLVVKTVAKSASCQVPGLITTLTQQIMNDAAAAGFGEAIHAFMQVDNNSLRRSRDFAGVTVRKYALFAKHC